MLFNSIEFLIFTVALLGVYSLTTPKYSVSVLLIASYIFYIFSGPIFFSLILLSTCIDYFISQKLQVTENQSARRRLLSLSLFVNLSLLVFFKYFNVVYPFIQKYWQSLNGVSLEIVLPLGISFYTLQTLGYTIDVFRKDIKAEKSFFNFALFVAYFPQLIAGPIERASHLLPKLKLAKKVSFESFRSGLMLILWGLIKKMAIADHLTVVTSPVFENPSLYNGLENGLVLFLYTAEIFCDFSGYCDIALGLSLLFGIELSRNFMRPMFAKSIREFWKRWHITLYFWFRDYLYIPLGGSRKGLMKTCLNVFITFTISGMWHGASWNFVLWGAIHGVYIIIETLLTSKLHIGLFRYNSNTFLIRIVNVLRVNFLIAVSWALFRASSIEDATLMIKKFIFLENWNTGISIFDGSLYSAVWICFSLVLIFLVFWVQRSISLRKWIGNQVPFVRYFVYLTGLLLLANFGVFTKERFIYFQF